MKSFTSYKFSKKINDEIHLLVTKDNWHCFLALLEDYFFIVISIIITYKISWYFYPLAMLIIASRQRALATLLHESAHKTLAKNKYLNFILGTFFSGYLVFQIMNSYYKSHVQHHHGNFGDKELDPDFKYMMQEGIYQNNQKPNQFIQKNIIAPMFLTKVPSYFRSILTQRLFEKDNRFELFVLVCWWSFIVFCLSWVNLLHLLVFFWLLPYLTVFQVIGWFIELCEHYPLMNNNVNLHMSRNRHSHWIEAFFTSIHNENYHLVHHLQPKIPFWNIPKAHQTFLSDPNYKGFDCKQGGILISSNQAESIIKNLILYYSEYQKMVD
ncbi:MAG: fatty acid desaturase family protein [Leptospiraceae bacterium]|nr:fatty acid desaturase family protein [Leptospiraceae bacterium]MCP5493850.1 fatty acid desaturase family protein [Leptospiraceae bacterium]